MSRIIFINGILASSEDKKLLSYNILHTDLQFSVTEDEFGTQYVTTFD